MNKDEMLQVFSELAEEILNEKVVIKEEYGLRSEQISIEEQSIGFSSLELIEFIIRVEEYYKISITEEEVAKLHLVKDLLEFIDVEKVKQERRDAAIEAASLEIFD
ncbi:hypothetical protein [Cellulosilyticum ruminicola]|uniref:hypothetical protein n=1 Tax=Cellulosilyticum ruminicola TaxID=425254 RepID=UPI0006CF967D|nr:hypothetical protein [Cellulosilyticum ruminicola]